MIDPAGGGAENGAGPGRGREASSTRPSLVARAIAWLQDNAARWVFPLMVAVSVGAFTISFPDATWGARWWVSLAVFLVLSGFPSWLYLRFLTVKLTPIYREFVHSLHRLGIDDPGNLPRPLESSAYFDRWQQSQDLRRRTARDRATDASPVTNLYDQKFVSHYGSFDREARFSGVGSLLPVIAAWIAFAVGWLTIVCNPAFVYPDLTLDDTLRFGFMGAYVFSLQLTVRAFFQNDLRSGTYVGIVERLVVVMVIVIVIFVAWTSVFDDGAQAALAVVAFVVGSFPLVGQEWLSQVAASRLRSKVPSVVSDHPLSEIDGMNVWYQARLLEEGIEDVQNLATADIVDVVMHSRAPVGRIVDWIDQALLHQHLPPENGGAKHPHTSDAVLLETLDALGVRTATDLLELHAPLSAGSMATLKRELHALEPEDCADGAFHRRMLDVIPDDQAKPLVELRMLGIIRCLGSEPNLRYVLNWRVGHAAARLASMSGESVTAVQPPTSPDATTDPVEPATGAGLQAVATSR